jgi:phage FluMu protein Com
MIHIQCPNCNKKLAVKESQAGVIGVCPACKSKFRVHKFLNEEFPCSIACSLARRSW